MRGVDTLRIILIYPKGSNLEPGQGGSVEIANIWLDSIGLCLKFLQINYAQAVFKRDDQTWVK